MKLTPVLIAPRMACREMLPGPDLDRLVDGGSYVQANMPKKRSKHSGEQRSFHRKRIEAGYRQMKLLLKPGLLEALHALRLPGESLAELLERMVEIHLKIQSESD